MQGQTAAPLVEIQDGKITCTNCHFVLAVKQNSGKGAAYARKQTKLNDSQIKICCWLLWCKYQDKWAGKQQLYDQYIKDGYTMNQRDFSKFISELVGIGIIDKTEERRVSYLETIEGPYYFFLIKKFNEILENRGRLN